MDIEFSKLIATSGVVAALVSGLVSYLFQGRLLERKAKLDYEFEARKRLYEAVGPLRLQLLLAARDVVRRFQGHHASRWTMEPDGYYVKSCVYRLLAPLAVGQLIERKVSLVDLSVDDEAIGLLKFVTSAERMLTGGDVVMDHPDVDWSSQSQHLFRDNLRAAAHTLLVPDGDRPGRLMTFSEFNTQFDLLKTASLQDLGLIFKACSASLTENPIFWARITAYSYACAEYLKSKSAKELGFASRHLAIDEMLKATNDSYFERNLGAFRERLRDVVDEPL